MKNSDSENSLPVYTAFLNVGEHYPKAKCLLLETKGRYFYAESFQEWIEIEEWEYRRVLKCPYHFYFSIALRTHCRWRNAVLEGVTLSFAEALAAASR